MRSVFFRRLLVALVIAMLLACAFMVAGYLYLSRDTYTDIKLEEMRPEANAITELLTERQNGGIGEAAFDRLYSALLSDTSVGVLLIDPSGNPVERGYRMFGLSADAAATAFQNQIRAILVGGSVSENNAAIQGLGRVVIVGEPVENGEQGGILGVLIVKSRADIIAASERKNSTLFLIITLVVPVSMLLVTFRIRRITEPLHAMSEAAIQMSKGDFDIRVSEDEPGEVGVLARALNNLCEALSGSIYQLCSEKVQLDEILQSLSDGVAVTDSLGMLTHYNSALMRMFGAVKVEKREELVADSMVWKAFDEVFYSGAPQTLTYPMAGDKTLWITISPVMDGDGNRTGVVGLFKDMTEMERLEATRREYVANISHELRTPLTAVRGLLEPLADGMVKSEEDRQRYYKIMLHEVTRLSRLITDMLALSRLQSGTEYMELSRVNLDELVRDIAQGYAGAASQNGIELIVEAENDPDGLTDPDRIEQVLVILLDNAMRYTPSGGSITLSVHNGKRLLVSVADTGCGIPEADLPHVFERFYKVDKSRNEGGTGLGLSIAHYIMEKLGETITVDSELDKGTRFTFTVKKYVSNAIQLGPANEERIPLAAESDEANKDAPEVDAPYEVLEEPQKKEPPRPARKRDKT
ncbi:MAG: ATP-binding protein [Clostridiaceae bacterium]|nr:cell wall metabolism sensor histidine kinase WalK [Eubacteriales bacterium]